MEELKGSAEIDWKNPHAFFQGMRERLPGGEYIQFLEAMSWGLMQKMEEDSGKIKSLWKVINVATSNLQSLKAAVEHSNKFRGKKISKRNEILYAEIERTYKTSKKEFGEFSHRFAVNKVAKNHRIGASSLYTNYMKWRYRLYVKSSKKRPT